MSAKAEQVVSLSYVPHKPSTGSLQEAFHVGRYDHRYRWALAGTGSGKTHAAAYDVLCWMTTDENPAGVALCCEPDIPMLGRVMIPAFEQHLGTSIENSPLTESWNKVERRWELVNGWVVWFLGLEKPEKVEGPNVDLIWADEIRLVRKWGGEGGAWANLRRRLRGSRPGNRMGFIGTTHSPTEEQDLEAHRLQNEGIGRVYRWSTLAARRAGTLPEEYDEVIRSYTGKAAERVLEGKHALAEGLVYDNFDPARHVIPWPTLPDGRAIRADMMSYGVDWGWTQAACLSAIAWRGESSHVVEEFYGSHYGVERLIDQAHDMEQRWGRGVWYCGADQPGHTDKFLKAGLQAVAYVGKVKDGCELLNDKLLGDTHHIAPSCVNTIREKKSYGRKPGTDDPEKGDEHSQDAERYGTMGPTRSPAVRVFRQSTRPGSAAPQVGVLKQVRRAWRHPRLP